MQPVLKTKQELIDFCVFLPSPAWIINEQKEAYFFNAPWLNFTGHNLEDDLGAAWHKVLHPTDLDNFLAVFKSSNERKEGFKIKCRLRHYDSKYIRFLAQGIPTRTSEGKFSGFLIYLFDVEALQSPDTEGKILSLDATLGKEQALNEELAAINEEMSATNEELISTNEELQKTQNDLAYLNAELEAIVFDRTRSLEENQHRTRSMIDTAPFPIGVYVGKEMRIEFANKAIMDVWGKGDDVIGRLYSEVLPELRDQAIFSQLDEVFNSGVSFHAKNQRVDLNISGQLTHFYFNYSFTALRDQNGEIYGVMNTAADVTEIVQAKMAVDQSKQELHNMILQAPVAMCLLSGPDHILTIANDLMIELGGKPANEVMNKPIFEGYPDTKSQGFDILLSDVYKSGSSFKAQERPVSLIRNGRQETLYLNFVYEPYRDLTGKVTGITTITTDVTEQVLSRQLLEKTYREQQDISEELAASNEELAAMNEELTAINEDITEAQESLMRSENLFRAIALNIPDSLVIVIDKEHRFLAIEGDLMQKLGYNSTDFIGKHPREATSPERYEASRDLYERVLAGERFSVERKSATGEDFIVHLVPLKDEANEIYAGLMIALDITRIKNAEVQSAKLAAIVHTSNDAIISKTLDGIITSWNKSAETIFGYKEDEMIGESILKLIPKDRHSEEPALIARIKLGERIQHFETQRVRNDGSMIDVSLSISPVTDSQGNIIGVSKIARDISEKKLEETRKNDFIAMVSHELKTPLTSLTALLQVLNLKLKTTNDSFIIGATEKANVQVKKMANMINGFLNVARLESGQLLIEPSAFEIRELIIDVIENSNLLVPENTILFSKGDKIKVVADSNKISSVISNLINNAVKYSPKGSRITVTSIVSQGSLKVSVQDEGFGIHAQDIERLFERYYRVDTSDTKHISGFGIGLYLSSEIIKKHGGNIWAESELGKGSTFHFTLPL